MSDIQQKDITQSTQQILGMLPASFAPGRSVAGVDKVDDKKATYESLIDYADGGSRDNPGQSVASFGLIDTAALSFTRKGA